MYGVWFILFYKWWYFIDETNLSAQWEQILNLAKNVWGFIKKKKKPVCMKFLSSLSIKINELFKSQLLHKVQVETGMGYQNIPLRVGQSWISASWFYGHNNLCLQLLFSGYNTIIIIIITNKIHSPLIKKKNPSYQLKAERGTSMKYPVPTSTRTLSASSRVPGT